MALGPVEVDFGGIVCDFLQGVRDLNVSLNSPTSFKRRPGPKTLEAVPPCPHDRNAPAVPTVYPVSTSAVHTCF